VPSARNGPCGTRPTSPGSSCPTPWGRSDAFLRVLFEHWISLAGKRRADHLLDSMLLFCMSAAYLAAKPDTVTEFRASTLPDLDGFRAAAAR